MAVKEKEKKREKITGCLHDNPIYRLAVCWCEKCLPQNLAEIRLTNVAEDLAREIEAAEED